VYAGEVIPKSRMITICGGKYLTADQGRERAVKTHIRTIHSRFLCVDAMSMDENGCTRQDLVNAHTVGGFVNSSQQTNFEQNCTFFKQEMCCGFPRIDKEPEIQSVDRIMLRATI
jgi:hypothetical protein